MWLYASAAEQYLDRGVYFEWECYQLDASTFITQDAFELIAGNQRDHYMAWKNGCIDERSARYWNEPAVMSYLVDCSIEDADGDACCWIDAQSIDYARSCTLPPLLMMRHEVTRGRLDAPTSAWHIVAAIEDGLNYALYGHPNIDIIGWDGTTVIVSVCQSDRTVAVMVERDVVTMQAMLHDEPCSVPASSIGTVPRATNTYPSTTGVSGRRKRPSITRSAGWMTWLEGPLTLPVRAAGVRRSPNQRHRPCRRHPPCRRSRGTTDPAALRVSPSLVRTPIRRSRASPPPPIRRAGAGRARGCASASPSRTPRSTWASNGANTPRAHARSIR